MTQINNVLLPFSNLEPQHKRPLRLWDPRDYMRLFYWAIFFPQALRWYVEQHGVQFSDGTFQAFWHTLRHEKAMMRELGERGRQDGLVWGREDGPGAGPDMLERIQGSFGR